jgi:four helix bundle protein
MSGKINSHRDLRVYQRAHAAAMRIFTLSQSLPREETFSLKDQIRRSSRSVCANLAEAWRKRRYEAHFISKLSDAEAEAAETQVWLDFARDCSYWSAEVTDELDREYEAVLGTIVGMINHPETWIIGQSA